MLTLLNIFGETLGIVDGLFAGCVCIQMGSHVLHFQLEICLRSLSSTLESHVFQEMGNAIVLFCLIPASSINPNTNLQRTRSDCIIKKVHRDDDSRGRMQLAYQFANCPEIQLSNFHSAYERNKKCTVAVGIPESSEATRRPLDRVVTRVSGTLRITCS